MSRRDLGSGETPQVSHHNLGGVQIDGVEAAMPPLRAGKRRGTHVPVARQNVVRKTHPQRSPGAASPRRSPCPSHAERCRRHMGRVHLTLTHREPQARAPVRPSDRDRPTRTRARCAPGARRPASPVEHARSSVRAIDPRAWSAQPMPGSANTPTRSQRSSRKLTASFEFMQHERRWAFKYSDKI